MELQPAGAPRLGGDAKRARDQRSLPGALKHLRGVEARHLETLRRLVEAGAGAEDTSSADAGSSDGSSEEGCIDRVEARQDTFEGQMRMASPAGAYLPASAAHTSSPPKRRPLDVPIVVLVPSDARRSRGSGSNGHLTSAWDGADGGGGRALAAASVVSHVRNDRGQSWFLGFQSGSEDGRRPGGQLRGRSSLLTATAGDERSVTAPAIGHAVSGTGHGPSGRTISAAQSAVRGTPSSSSQPGRSSVRSPVVPVPEESLPKGQGAAGIRGTILHFRRKPPVPAQQPYWKQGHRQQQAPRFQEQAELLPEIKQDEPEISDKSRAGAQTHNSPMSSSPCSSKPGGIGGHQDCSFPPAIGVEDLLSALRWALSSSISANARAIKVISMEQGYPSSSSSHPPPEWQVAGATGAEDGAQVDESEQTLRLRCEALASASARRREALARAAVQAAEKALHSER